MEPNSARMPPYVNITNSKTIYNYRHLLAAANRVSKILVKKELQNFCLKATSPRASSFKTVVSSKDADCGPPLALCDSLIFAAKNKHIPETGHTHIHRGLNQVKMMMTMTTKVGLTWFNSISL